MTMPVKRRVMKAKVEYPHVIQQLIDGEAIEPSEDARQVLLGFVYLCEHEELGLELRQEAADLIRGWRP